MAYVNSSTTGGLGILSALSSFLTSNGWTLHDDLGDHDKVFYSSGASGKQNHYVRVTATQKLLHFSGASGTRTGDVVTGGTSGTTATIVSQTGDGTNAVGTLVLCDPSGHFNAGETITAAGGWSATVAIVGSGPTVYGFGYSANQYSVRLATAAALPAYTGSGSGASRTLTANANGALSVDGVAVAVGDRILNRNAGVDAGVYTVTAAGSGGAPFVLTRAADFNSSGDIAQGYWTSVLAGDTLRATGWRLDQAAPTLESTSLSFTKYRGVGFRDPADPHNTFDWLLFRTYTFWNAGGHTGVNEAGQYGPTIESVASYTNTTPKRYACRLDIKLRSDAPISLLAQGFRSVNSLGKDFDGHRRMFGFPYYNTGTAVCDLIDLSTMTIKALSTTGIATGPTQNEGLGGPLVVDKLLDKYLYYTQTASAAPNRILRWDEDTDTWGTIANSTGFVSATADDDNAIGCWDGRDKIYFQSSGTSTLFSRYNIGANTWTALAAGPANSANVAAWGAIPYIPAGCISGVSEDLYLRAFRVAATIERYNVASNTWGTVSVPQTTVTVDSDLIWDSVENILYYQPTQNSTIAYVADLSAGLTWSGTSIGHIPGARLTDDNRLPRFFHHFLCKLRTSPTGSTTYHFVGDEDTFSVVLIAPSGKTFWATAGLQNTRHRTEIMVTTGSVSPGSPVTIAVDSTDGFSAGDEVLLLDPTNGRLATTRIIGLSATTIDAVVPVAFSTGTLIFTDGVNCILAGDSNQAVAAYTRRGHRAAYMGDRYRLTPLARSFVSSSVLPISAAPTANLWPLAIYDMETEVPSTYGVQGTLRQVLDVGTGGSFPAAQVGLRLRTFGGDEYLIFSSEYDRYATESRLLAVGPVN